MAAPSKVAARKIAEMLTDLVGKDVEGNPADAPATLNEEPAFLATYVDETGKIIGLCRCDLSAAASLAAALQMLPEKSVDECISNGKLDEMLFENHWEICNVLGQAFNAPGQPIITMKDMAALPLAEDAGIDLTRAPGSRHDINVAVEGYKDGVLTLARL